MRLLAPWALLPAGWAPEVAIDIDAHGTIARVTPQAAETNVERAAGPLVPGMPNLHSHAFQRALAGRTGRANEGGDSFWTWRNAMYAMLDRIDADALEAITAQAYVEMLKSGYTAVAEFHYVHHDPRGAPYADPAELAHRVLAAAADAGIALTLLPVFYAHAGFGGSPPAAGQRRFLHTVDSFSRLVASLAPDAAARGVVVGVAPHSLRAATPEEMAAVVAAAPAGAPIHIHAAEQEREVGECLAWSGLRPIEWLLEHAHLDGHWCVIHATHMTADETRRLAASGATAGLAPTTEADLGDGTFPARAFEDAGGAFGVGSDSNTVIDPFAELRQLEWSQRLLRRARNILADGDQPVGQALYRRAAVGGGCALAQNVGSIAEGLRADLVVLDGDDPALAGVPHDALLDAAIFGPCRRPVRDVMVGGYWVVRDGRHPKEEAVLRRYRTATAELK
jgi:formimidoylglutamate deiminase